MRDDSAHNFNLNTASWWKREKRSVTKHGRRIFTNNPYCLHMLCRGLKARVQQLTLDGQTKAAVRDELKDQISYVCTCQ